MPIREMGEEFHTDCDKLAVYVSNVHTQPSRGIGESAKSFVYSGLRCLFDGVRCEESAHTKLKQRARRLMPVQTLIEYLEGGE